MVFFDELDALVPRRDDSMVCHFVPSLEQTLILLQSESSARVVNTLLTELDGLDARKSVYVIAATNRPDMIDPAMCRPGRLDKLLYIDLPSSDERAEILRTMTRKVPLGGASGEDDVAVRQALEGAVRERCEGYSGADLAALVREAGVAALKRTLGVLELLEQSGKTEELGEDSVKVTLPDFLQALEKVQPSVSVQQRKKYEALRSKFAGLPTGSGRSRGSEDKTVE